MIERHCDTIKLSFEVGAFCDRECQTYFSSVVKRLYWRYWEYPNIRYSNRNFRFGEKFLTTVKKTASFRAITFCLTENLGIFFFHIGCQQIIVGVHTKMSIYTKIKSLLIRIRRSIGNSAMALTAQMDRGGVRHRRRSMTLNSDRNFVLTHCSVTEKDSSFIEKYRQIYIKWSPRFERSDD